MSQAKRFFRKYLCSSLGILLVFLTVNLVLFLLVSLGAMQGLPRPNSPTRFLRELAGELSLEDGSSGSRTGSKRAWNGRTPGLCCWTEEER